jgi:hypothetical protein
MVASALIAAVYCCVQSGSSDALRSSVRTPSTAVQPGYPFSVSRGGCARGPARVDAMTYRMQACGTAVGVRPTRASSERRWLLDRSTEGAT